MNLTIRRPDDFHCHFRWDDRLETVLGFTARVFGRALDMPNWKIEGHPWGTEAIPWAPGVRAQDVLKHRAMIQTLCQIDGCNFEPVGCMYITEQTTPVMIGEAARAGIRACKTFFRGVSTNSGWGVRDPLSTEHRLLLTAMADHNLVNSMHVEKPESFIMDAESEALGVFERIVNDFPSLNSVFEHYSSLDHLEHFASENGAEFYGLPLNEGIITLVKRPWEVPAEYNGIVPFLAGETLDWQVEGVDFS